MIANKTPAAVRRGYPSAEAATYLGLSPHTLEDWRRRGIGPTYRRVGSNSRARILYLIEDLDAYLAGLDVVKGGAPA